MPFELPLALLHTITPDDKAQVGRAVSLFMIVAVLMGVLLLGVVLLLIAHRLRRTPRAVASKQLPDAWREAARRVKTDELGGDDDS